jgi:hypothetical protein
MLDCAIALHRVRAVWRRSLWEWGRVDITANLDEPSRDSHVQSYVSLYI